MEKRTFAEKTITQSGDIHRQTDVHSMNLWKFMLEKSKDWRRERESECEWRKKRRTWRWCVFVRDVLTMDLSWFFVNFVVILCDARHEPWIRCIQHKTLTIICKGKRKRRNDFFVTQKHLRLRLTDCVGSAKRHFLIDSFSVRSLCVWILFLYSLWVVSPNDFWHTH